jgi:hyperosmotically inducible protein
MRGSEAFRHLVFFLVPFIVMSLVSCRTPAGRSAGDVVDDSAITTKVKAKLLEDQRLKGFGIDVDTHQGEVTLTGGVDTAESKSRASQLARSVDGVKRINNMLKVAG